jgi:hypothetical protein
MAFLNQDLREHEMAKQAPVAAPAQGPKSQLRLNQLDAQGCVFVLRFILSAFRARRPEDRFWSLLRQFLFDAQGLGEPEGVIAKHLLSQASCLEPEQARALLAHLSQAYAQTNDRLFWRTLSDAMQLYPMAPVI